jgi:hypothetical protein
MGIIPYLEDGLANIKDDNLNGVGKSVDLLIGQT